ncbi:hypothetical protein Mal15_52920 [Stieleria maiorica]|uniref:Uncharacterized protein n=1 Tax=Stieleria maiorica TaxID=2795974 RepID=A0A5B9MNP6_9BACT|nr:hypothetical protein [Stieleria maiorica]QEG01216.1 hypothetical protein Mal15_52920 [Stieleria maiorica]
MNRLRKSLCVAIVGGMLATVPSESSGQDIIGEALGKVILPAVGPVILDRAGGQILEKGLNGGFRRGGGLPGRGSSRPSRRQGSSGSQTIPSQTYQVQPQPQSSPQPSPSPAPTPPAVRPPANTIVARPAVSPNPSPTEIALTHVVSAGPQLTAQVIRVEAAEIASQIDQAVARFLDQSSSDPAVDSLRRDYGRLSNQSRDEGARSALLAGHDDALAQLGNRQSWTSLIGAADAADRIAALAPESDSETLTQAIDELRSELTGVTGPVLTGNELAIIAQRAKNIRNMSVMSEIARVLGAQRRDDLFVRIAEAAVKSDAPEEAIAGLLGVGLGLAGNAVTDMQLPEGIPAVVLYSPSINTSPISFVCDDALEITLAPGEMVPLDQAFVVAFQNGKGAVKRYTINDGMYRWVVGQNGWDVRQKTAVEVSIDASGSPAEFHYLINGQPQSAPAGSVIEHRLDGPVRIDFDTGLGDGSSNSTLVTPGNYVVGVNAETGGWDLHIQRQPQSVEESTTSIAKQHWRESVAQAQRRLSIDPAEAKVDALLDLIE